MREPLMHDPRMHLGLRRVARPARGIGLLDALIAMAILAFGLLGVTRMQTSLMRQGTESLSRLTAAQLGDELLSTVFADAGNAGCYVLPTPVACTSTVARARAVEWQGRVAGALPGTVQAESELTGSQFMVTLTWTGKDSGETRTLEVTTDVGD
jgi:type IV pilus assembly protein PilV